MKIIGLLLVACVLLAVACEAQILREKLSKRIQEHLNNKRTSNGQTFKIPIVQADTPVKSKKFNVGNSFQPEGLYVIVRNDILMETANQVSLQIAGIANNYTTMPDYSGSTSSANFDFSSFLFDIWLDEPEISSSGAPSLTIGWGQFDFIFQFNYHICSTSWPNPCENGFVLIYTTDSDVMLTADLTIDVSGPQVSASCDDVTLGFNQGDIEIDVQCTDTFCLIPTGDIANAVAGQFQSVFQSGIQTAINQAAATTINQIMTSYNIPAAGLTFQFDGNFYLFPSTSPNLVFSLDGMFIPDGKAGQTPPFSPTVSPPDSVFTSPSGQLSIIYTDFLVRSVIWALDLQGEFNLTITNSEIPPSSPIHLTTADSAMQGAVPGVKEYPGCDINVITSLVNVSSVDVTGAPGLKILSSLYADFVITNATFTKWAFRLEVDVTVVGTVSTLFNTTVNQVQLDMALGGWVVDVSLVDTAIGTVNAGFFKFVISVGISGFAPVPPPIFVPNIPDFAFSSPAYAESVGYGILSTNIDYTANIPVEVCDSTFVCPIETTCCNWNNAWACCTLPEASCCDDGGCCPNGTQCDGQGGCQ